MAEKPLATSPLSLVIHRRRDQRLQVLFCLFPCLVLEAKQSESGKLKALKSFHQEVAQGGAVPQVESDCLLDAAHGILRKCRRVNDR
jgi:hypothetical protein